MKKTISLLLALLLVFGLLPTNAARAAGEEELLSAVDVTADTWALLPGETVQLTVSPLDETGQPFDGFVNVTYTSINPYVATVDTSGLVTAVHVGVTRVIVAAQGPHNMVSKTVSLVVTQTADKILTFEDMTVDTAPTGVYASNLATVADMGKDSARSVDINDNVDGAGLPATAYLHYRTDAASVLTLDFDVRRNSGSVFVKILNGADNTNANTAFWLQFSATQTRYYNGSGYVELFPQGLLADQWYSVHIEITNKDRTQGEAAIYINGVLMGTAQKTVGSAYQTDAAVDGVCFVSGGGTATGDRFYIDSLQLTADKRATFESMPADAAPSTVTFGSGIQSSNLATVTDARGKDSSKSVYVNDNVSGTTSDATAWLHYATAPSATLTLDFDIYPENGNVALKILNGGHSTANTAFWIRFISNKTSYYTGSGYVDLGDKTLPRNQWASVHIEITNTGDQAGAKVYINGELVSRELASGEIVDKVPKIVLPSPGYGSNTASLVSGVYFISSGGSDANDRFYVDNLRLTRDIVPVSPPPVPETPKLSVALGGMFDVADNSEVIRNDNGELIEEDYIKEDYADDYGFCLIPFTFAPSSMNKVYINYSRHRDVVMDDPIDSVRIYDPDTLLEAKDGDQLQTEYEAMKTDRDLFFMAMAELPDGRLFAQNYIPYYLTNTTARTASWLIDADGKWTKVVGTLSLPGMGVTAPIANSTWYPYVFSKGIEVLVDEHDNVTLLHTMYGMSKALLIQSTDLGQTWTLRSIIAENDGTHFNTDGTSIKYYEPSLQRCKDGSLLSIIRTDSNKPLWQSRSYDDGLTWSRPILLPGVSPTDARSIYPQTKLLDNGVLALTTGRPNNTMLFSLDGSGYRWGYTTTTYAPASQTQTTGNTSLAQIAPNTLLVVGDRGFIQNELAGVWGRVVEVTRNTVPDPVLESAVLRADQSMLALGSSLQLRIDGIFDSNWDLIPLKDCKVQYYSESPELASVDINSGLVTALAAGPVRLIASVTSDGMTILTDPISLLMTDEEELYASSPAIDRWRLVPGESAQITPSAFNRFGNKIGGVSWSYESSDEAVLTVDSNGRVEAVDFGVAEVIVTAQKAADTLVRRVAVIVGNGLWTLQDFESSTAGGSLPAGYTATAGASISDAQAYSGTKSLYIKDDISTAINVTGSFPSAKGAVIEFMLYPEKAEHSVSIGIGATGTAVGNETCLFGFTVPPQGSDIQRVQAYDGFSWAFVNQNSGVRMNTWNKIRVEVTVDKPSRLYVNDRFVAALPVVAAQQNLSRIRFTTGGSDYVDDYYYIDDVKVMTFDPADMQRVALSDLSFGGSTVPSFDLDIFLYQMRLPASQRSLAVTAVPADDGANVTVDRSDPAKARVEVAYTVMSQDTPPLALRKLLGEYLLNFSWYADEDDSEAPPAPPSAAFLPSAKALSYIEGYPDNSFRPEQHTTRAELAQMLYRLAEFKNASKTSASFGDVPSDMWAAQAIHALAGLDILPGENGSFKPDQPVTRSQAMRAIALLMGKAPAGSSSFADSQGHPYEGYLAAMEAAGIAKGYPDGTLRPDAPLTRAEMVTLINRALGKAPATTSSTFTDLSAEHWAAGDILAAVK